MAEDDLDSFDTAWNKYMGDQALMIQPIPEPSADGNLLNHQESIAFSRFFDNLLAQPSSPRRTARRLDEELQRLSYATQPYAPSAEHANDENIQASEVYSTDQQMPQPAHPPPQQQQFTMASSDIGSSAYPIDQRRFVASQPVYGNTLYDQHQSQHEHEHEHENNQNHLSFISLEYPPNGFQKHSAPFLAETYGGAKLPKQDNVGTSLFDHNQSRQAPYNYALGSGMSPQEQFTTDPQLDPQFYPTPYIDGSNTEDRSRSASIVHESKRARRDSELPPEKRARTQRGETQTKVNHMNNEKRRRAHIRDLFDRMCSLVPRVLKTDETLPKSLVLQETHNRLLELETQNAQLRDQLAARGIDTASVPAIILDPHPTR